MKQQNRRREENLKLFCWRRMRDFLAVENDPDLEKITFSSWTETSVWLDSYPAKKLEFWRWGKWKTSKLLYIDTFDTMNRWQPTSYSVIEFYIFQNETAAACRRRRRGSVWNVIFCVLSWCAVVPPTIKWVALKARTLVLIFFTLFVPGKCRPIFTTSEFL